jgi:hypothetical protein
LTNGVRPESVETVIRGAISGGLQGSRYCSAGTTTIQIFAGSSGLLVSTPFERVTIARD